MSLYYSKRDIETPTGKSEGAGCDVCLARKVMLRILHELDIYFRHTEVPVMTSPLEKEFEYYLQNQEELVKEHEGKIEVIPITSLVLNGVLPPALPPSAWITASSISIVPSITTSRNEF